MKNLFKIILAILAILSGLTSCSGNQDTKSEATSDIETSSALIEDVSSIEDSTNTKKVLFVSYNYFCYPVVNGERYTLYFNVYSSFTVRIAETYADSTYKIVHESEDKHSFNFMYGNVMKPNLEGWIIELYATDTPEYIWCFIVNRPDTERC